MFGQRLGIWGRSQRPVERIGFRAAGGVGVGGDGAVSGRGLSPLSGLAFCRGPNSRGLRPWLLTCVPSGLTVVVFDGLGIVSPYRGITIRGAVLCSQPVIPAKTRIEG